MRMAALMEVIKDDKAVHSAYLIGQDYSFGQAVLREARRQLGMQRPDVRIVGDELHPWPRQDFAPYAVKIKQSGAQAVITGNWGNDLMLLVKAAREAGYEGASTPSTAMPWELRRPWAMPAWARCWPVPTGCPMCHGRDRAFYQSFRQRFPRPQDDYVHMRMQLMIEALRRASKNRQHGHRRRGPCLGACQGPAGGTLGQHAGGRPPVSAIAGGGHDGKER
jgi:branched-chain amino acid transport system substrate-binding protein